MAAGAVLYFFVFPVPTTDCPRHLYRPTICQTHILIQNSACSPMCLVFSAALAPMHILTPFNPLPPPVFPASVSEKQAAHRLFKQIGECTRRREYFVAFAMFVRPRDAPLVSMEALPGWVQYDLQNNPVRKDADDKAKLAFLESFDGAEV